METDSKKTDYCEAAIEFAKQVDYLIDIYNSREYPNRPNGTTAYFSDGYHTLTIWNDKLSLCRVEENSGFRHRKEIGDALIINNRVHLAPLLKKYLDSLRGQTQEL